MENFDERFETFLAGTQAIINKYMEETFPTLNNPRLTVKKGRRYILITHEHSAFAFVDMKTGDVLKPATYKTPAKGARGNIFDSKNGLGRMTPYGPEYNR